MNREDICPLCEATFTPDRDGATYFYCSELCRELSESYPDETDQTPAALPDPVRELLAAINDSPEDDHTDRLSELYGVYEMSPNRLAQHTPYGDRRIRECLREEGSYRESAERELRARLSDPEFGPEDLGLSPIGEVAHQ